MTRGLAAGLALAALVAGVGFVAFVAASGDEPYAALRQEASQEIPGTLGLSLEPPGDVDPILPPDEARARNLVPPEAEVHVTLAIVRDRFEGTDIGPAWVLFARGVCLRNAKGELVSSARGEDPGAALECTPATMWVLAVSPEDGEPLLATTGYDETQDWRPLVAGTD
jgi:hypothetical protein